MESLLPLRVCCTIITHVFDDGAPKKKQEK